MSYNTKDIRNISLIGHTSCGKTTLNEAILYSGNVIPLMGKVDDGKSVSDHSEQEIEKGITKYTKFIEKNGGAVKSVDRWGKRRLAYEIKKKQYGYYVYVRFEMDGSQIKELEREYKLDDSILRYLTVLVPKVVVSQEHLVKSRPASPDADTKEETEEKPVKEEKAEAVKEKTEEDKTEETKEETAEEKDAEPAETDQAEENQADGA